LCLDENCILILDGIDECTDNNIFITSLLRISTVAKPKILVLSRVHVLRLRRRIPRSFQMEFSRELASRDVCVFLDKDIFYLHEHGRNG
jgi:hypothetical protein